MPALHVSIAPTLELFHSITPAWALTALELLLSGAGWYWGEACQWWAVFADVSIPSYQLFKSSSFAWTFYWFNVACAHSRIDEVIRLKVLVVPAFVLYITMQSIPEYVISVIIALLVWVLIAISMDLREGRERREGQQVLQDIQLHRAQSLSSNAFTLPPDATPSRIFSSDECIVCMQRYDEDASQVKHTLQCGHQFHRTCLELWLSSSQQGKCPTCRQSVNPTNASVAMQIIF